ncbi:MAG: glycosyltransferase, partial [Candidatus Yanofskybacteria bacterium]|nr:glycosyltransferase [Candidatus Yanofskybacteria bacterium]
MAKRILLVGGGSGGHAYPLLAVAQALKIEAEKTNTKVEFLMLGSPGFLQKAAQESGIRWKRVTAGKLRRYFDPRTILDFIKIPVSFIQSFWHLFWFMPDIIFSKGGYDSVAPAIVGWLYMIPVFVHESDSVPGLANRVIAKFARAVFVGFKSAEKYFPKSQVIFVGNPVRSEILSGNKQEGLRYFNLKDGKRTVLISGGGQGAKVVNDIIINSLVLLVKDYQ